jgi:hypothetical protein
LLKKENLKTVCVQITKDENLEFLEQIRNFLKIIIKIKNKEDLKIINKIKNFKKIIYIFDLKYDRFDLHRIKKYINLISFDSEIIFDINELKSQNDVKSSYFLKIFNIIKDL